MTAKRPKQQQISLIALFVEGTRDIILYNGEREDAPNVSTLLGGKVGDDKNTPLENIAEQMNPLWTVLRETAEEGGPHVRPRNIKHAFDLTCLHVFGRHRKIHLYVGEVPEDEVKNLEVAPGAPGQFIRHNIDEIQMDPLANNPAISPLNLALLQILQRDWITGKHYKHFERHMSLKQFEMRLSLPPEKQKSIQRGLKAA